MPRQADDEYTPRARDITNRQGSQIGFDILSRNRKSQPEAGPVGIVLLERNKHPHQGTGQQAAATVMHLDQDELTGGQCTQGHHTVLARELERASDSPISKPKVEWLRFDTAPMVPATGMLLSSRAHTACVAVSNTLRSSWARNPTLLLVDQLLVCHQGIALCAELRDGVCNGIVQAAVQRAGLATVKGSFRSNAMPVMAWHKSP